MAEIIFFKNTIEVETISINRRYVIKHRNIQAQLNKHYSNKEDYIIKCTCKDEDIFMYLSKRNYVNICSNPGYADKHTGTCPFNSQIIKLNEKYYKFEDEVFTTNIFLDKSHSSKPNENIEYDNFSYRLATQDDDNINISQRTSRNYIRYKNYNDFCLLVLQTTLKKLEQNSSIEFFIKKCKRTIFNMKVHHKSNTILVSAYINQIKEETHKSFGFEISILENEFDILNLKKNCSNNSQRTLLNNISTYNSPILVIYFNKNFKITSLFAIDIKLIIEQIEDSHKKEDCEDELAKEKTLLASNKLEINELKIELNSIKKDNSLLEKRKKSLLLEIEEINIEIDRLNGLKDKVLFFMENKNKTEPLKKAKQKLEETENNFKTLKIYINDNYKSINYLDEQIQNLHLEITKNQQKIITLETLLEKGSIKENKLIDLDDLKEKLNILI